MGDVTRFPGRDPFGRPSNPDRRVDTETRERVVGLEQRYRRVARRLTLAVAIMGVTIAALTAISVGLIGENSRRSDQIQRQRIGAILSSCREQNGRHDASVAALTKGAKIDEDARSTEAGKREVRRRRDVTIALLDALAPVRDCDALVRRSVRSVG